MSNKPIVLLAHPRSCSTAFERMFLGQADRIVCIHEPFCDAYHFGPERLSERFEDEHFRTQSGFSQSTYQTVLNNIENLHIDGRRTFIKDMAKSLMPPAGRPVQSLELPSLQELYPVTGDQAIGKVRNPTVLPPQVLRGYHFTFLIRHPSLSIPSLYRISTPPVSSITNWHGFHADDCGYVELRRLFDYLKDDQQIGPPIVGHKSHDCKPQQAKGSNDSHANPEICLIDAGDLLREPEKVCRAYCKSVNLQFDESMLEWDSGKDRERAEQAFQKSRAIHIDALNSKFLKAPERDCDMLSTENKNAQWIEKYGEAGAKIISDHVNANLPHYEYLKQFALRI